MGDLKDAESVGQVFWPRLLVLARAGGRLREDLIVLHFLKKALDDASSDQRGPIAPISEAP
jgi:hypothetical protein